MPKALERKLMVEAMKKRMSKKKKGAYVYGTMRKMGWKPEREKDSEDEKMSHLAMKMRASIKRA